MTCVGLALLLIFGKTYDYEFMRIASASYEIYPVEVRPLGSGCLLSGSSFPQILKAPTCPRFCIDDQTSNFHYIFCFL